MAEPFRHDLKPSEFFGIFRHLVLVPDTTLQERFVAMVVTISASAAITLMDLLLSRYIQFLFFIFSKTLLFLMFSL